MSRQILLLLVPLCVLLFLVSQNTLASDAQGSSALESLHQRVNSIEKDINKNSEILQVQRDMFNFSIAVIVTIFLFFTGLTYLYNFRIARRQVNNSLAKFKREINEKIEKIQKDSLVSAGNLLEDYSKKFESKIKRLEGHHYDALGRLYLGQSAYYAAFMWFVRAYQSLYESVNKEFLNIILENIVTCLSKMTYIDSSDMAEVSKLMPLISDTLDQPRREYIIKRIGDLSTPKETKQL